MPSAENTAGGGGGNATAPAPASSHSSSSASSTSSTESVAPPSGISSQLRPPGSFSSTPVGPVVASSHQRRWNSEANWMRSDRGERHRLQDGVALNSSNSDGRPLGRQSKNEVPPRPRRANYRPTHSPSPSNSDASRTSDEDIRGSRNANHNAAVSADGARNGGFPDRHRAAMSLPAISGAALLELRDRPSGGTGYRMPVGQEERGEHVAAGGRLAGPPPGLNQHGHSSHSPSPVDDEDQRNVGEQASVLYREDGMNRTPSPIEREVRIMFKGREIFADDLIGMRVAKTFAGHGRFLGQVVKFDGPAALYTIVYADGDAEDLNVENTIQILIQDEIERVDPSLPPPATSLFFKREGSGMAADSPTDAESSEVLSAGAYPPPHEYHTQQRVQASTFPEAAPRPAMRVTEREAQFVSGLFESHALPILLQQGWRVQRNASGGDVHYVAPGVGDGFSSSGAVFRSAMDVVEYIASDQELLTACFPVNVHSAILSLLPDSYRQAGEGAATSESAARKRGTADLPGVDGVASKRHRQPRDEAFATTSDGRRQTSATTPPRLSQPVSSHVYRSSESDHRPREREGVARRGVMAERGMVPDRFDDPSRNGTPASGGHPPYYATAGYRPVHPRHPSLNAPPPRWSGEQPVVSTVDKPIYQRRYTQESPRWRESEESSGHAAPYASDFPNGDAYLRGYSRTDRYYGNDRSAPRPAFRGSTAETPPDYRYPNSSESASNLPPEAYRHRYVDRGQPLPRREDVADGRQGNSVDSSAASRLQRDSAYFSSSDGMRRDNPAISMVDVDRNATARRVDQPNEHPSHGGEAAAGYAPYHDHHYPPQRAGGGHYAAGTGVSGPMPVSTNAPPPQEPPRSS